MYNRLIAAAFSIFSLGLSSMETLCAQINVASYDMHIVLDDDEKIITGNTILNWTNPSDKAVNTLQFHLYYNAFRNNRSTFFSEREGRMGFLASSMKESCNWSYSEIESFKDESGNELVQNTRYLQPDDDNSQDKTVLEIELSEPVAAGATAIFNFTWKAKIPKIMPRTGFNKDFIFMAQWFPKLGVYEIKGMRNRAEDGWNCHQYHGAGEYYADFGDYKLTIDLPKKYKLASTGVILAKEEKEGRTIWQVEANSVIDFTWSASPHFIEIKDKWKHVDLSMYCYPEHEHFADRYFKALMFSLEFMEQHLGEYPYPKLSILDAPFHGIFTGGMEYPMFITSFGFCFFPQKIRTPEILAVHEFVHQYFMQMVATNETEDPWMDEGLTSYYECRIVDELYGKHEAAIDVLNIQCGGQEYNRYELLVSEDYQVAPANYLSWEFPGNSYGTVAYNKTASILFSLEKLLSTEVFDACMKHYFIQWQFKHPGPQDFIEAVNSKVLELLPDLYPHGMDWFFDQTLYTDGFLDYEVLGFENHKPVSDAGFIEDIEDCRPYENLSNADYFLSEVHLRRQGQISIPVELKVNFKNGTSEYFLWDAQESHYSFKIKNNSEIISAELDPEFKLDLDINRLNNSKRVAGNSLTASKYGKKVQSIFQFVLEGLSLLF